MIIFGTKNSLVRTMPQPGLVCPSCANSEQMHLSVFSRYLHIYWIPLLPFAKTAVAQCLHCKGTWAQKELPAEASGMRQALETLKKQTRAPWWHWVGLLLLLAVAAFGLWMSGRNKEDNATYLAAPQAGDVYTVRKNDSTSEYSLLKVVSTQGNTVELVANEYATTNAHPLNKLNDPAKYSKQAFSLSRLDLQVMQQKGQLTDVDRLGK
ncbi:zinc ribbon domain-containing protein [Hymenobacter sp. J193]|uniref:zinc ribbon domain-containing protein n=1 Tax=Hymenobacter sp. J193 TaxID=2898429 RepID=UPI002150CB3F|nr:zinc ribbon domain-containing protein [Hymenobacter sp. J193]MCR5886432.1 zinc ribbon domain-containing protein [Hymenobacter sp. J193]